MPSAAFEYAIQEPEALPRTGNIVPLRVLKLSDVEAKNVNWLWQPMIPSGFFTLVDGPEGVGKTFSMLNVAAIAAAGLSFPGSPAPVQAGRVLLASAEDSAAFILKPRLEAMGAPCDQIYVIDEPFTFNDEGFLRLASLFEQHQFTFALIDPVFSFTGNIDINKDNEIRRVTDRLNRLAEAFDCAIVGTRHISKSKGFGDPRNAGLNGVGWRAGARSHLLIGHDPNDKAKRALVQTKSNLSAESHKAFGYEITTEGKFQWTGDSELTAETMLSYKESESVEEKGKKRQAMDFLSSILAEGKRGSQDVIDAARQAGITERTLSRAKSALGVSSKKDSDFHGGWYWILPESAKDASQARQRNVSGILQPGTANNVVPFSGIAEGCQNTISGVVRGSVGGRTYLTCKDCGKDGYSDQPCPYCVVMAI